MQEPGKPGFEKAPIRKYAIIRHMRIRQVVRVSDQGVSRPYQCYDENGVLRWCKGNHTGLRSLIAEWVCARIARELELPVPACDILRFDPTAFREWARCRGEHLPQLVTMKGILLRRDF